MGFPGYAGWTVVLDPTAVSSGRTELDINSSPFFIGNTGGGVGLDWGTSELTEYVAAQGRYGSTVADYVWPNRTITITLLAGDNVNEADVETALEDLRQKVALFQREGGWLQRQRLDGPNMYADIVDAQLAIPDVYAETGGVEPGITLTLTALPDFFGDAVTLDTQAATGVFQSVLTSSESDATISGDHPARACSVLVTDTSDNAQLGLIWGVRSRYYSSAFTAELVYEAEMLTPLNGAVTGTFAGASGGQAVTITGLPGGVWASFLATQVWPSAGGLTHTGTYNVWARVYSSTGTPELQFLWGMGDISVPVTNNAVTIPNSGAFYLVNLGPIRLDAPPVGAAEWYGVLQAYSPGGGDSVTCDVLYFQPLDDGAGQLTYVQEPPASSLSVTSNAPTTAASVTGVGTVAWLNPAGIEMLGTGAYAPLPSSGNITHYLEGTNYGFDLPSTATVQGIQVSILRQQPGAGNTTDYRVRLIKAGVVQSTADYARTSVRWPSGEGFATYGGTTDLWGTTWDYSDVNNTGFGVALAAQAKGTNQYDAYVFQIAVTIYYTLASGFSVSEDAVIYANDKCALRFDGHYRLGPSGVYASVSNVVGDYVRIPASGMEDRPCQLFVKPTRGDLNTLADSGLDGFTVQTTYRPSYVFRP